MLSGLSGLKNNKKEDTEVGRACVEGSRQWEELVLRGPDSGRGTC